MAWTPEQLEKITSRIPAEYQDNPEAFLEAFEKERNEASRYRDFYEKEYTPWYQQNGARFDEFQRSRDEWEAWRTGRGKEPEPDRTPERPVRTSSSRPKFDFEEPDAMEKVVDYFEDRFEDQRRHYEMLQNGFEQGKAELFNILKLTEEARQIQNSDLYNHIGYTPQVDLARVVKHAKETGSNLHAAYSAIYGPQEAERRARDAYDRGRQEAIREYEERITTEVTSGVPTMERRRVSHEVPRGYGKGNDVLLARIQKERMEKQRRSA